MRSKTARSWRSVRRSAAAWSSLARCERLGDVERGRQLARCDADVARALGDLVKQRGLAHLRRRARRDERPGAVAGLQQTVGLELGNRRTDGVVVDAELVGDFPQAGEPIAGAQAARDDGGANSPIQLDAERDVRRVVERDPGRGGPALRHASLRVAFRVALRACLLPVVPTHWYCRAPWDCSARSAT